MATPPPKTLDLANPAVLATLHLGSSETQTPQTKHRFDLARAFGVKPGDRVLEIGCGQGDMTAVLAVVVGSEGHVTAIDPASADYGSPYTLKQAQAHLSQSLLAPRITFHLGVQTDDFLAGISEGEFDCAVLAHSAWYFASPVALKDTLSLLAKKKVHRLHLAEWALSSPQPAAQPHILAALAYAALDTFAPDRDSNIHTVLAPGQMTNLCASAGWGRKIVESLVTPDEALQDGRWEVGALRTHGGAALDLLDVEREKCLIQAMKEAVATSVVALGGIRQVRSMDVWLSTFEREK